MKINPVAASSTPWNVAESGSSALVAHTNADHAHQISASTSPARPSPAQVSSWLNNVMTCVTAKTNTRSHRSSTGVVDRSALASASFCSVGSAATRGVSNSLRARAPTIARRAGAPLGRLGWLR